MVAASNPDPDRNYRLADGSLIPHRGDKKFSAVTNEGVRKGVKSAVTDVDKPLLSVSQLIAAGGEVVFKKGGSYIQEAGGKQRIGLEQRGGLFVLKKWVPREQPHFHGQAQKP